MSNQADDLADTIANAASTWLATQGGGFVTAFTACFEYVDTDGDRAWATAHAPDQTPSQTLGLLRWHTINAEAQCQSFMFEDDDDE